MTTHTIYTRDEMITLTNESIKKGHRALENALKNEHLSDYECIFDPPVSADELLKSF